MSKRVKKKILKEQKREGGGFEVILREEEKQGELNIVSTPPRRERTLGSAKGKELKKGGGFSPEKKEKFMVCTYSWVYKGKGPLARKGGKMEFLWVHWKRGSKNIGLEKKDSKKERLSRKGRGERKQQQRDGEIDMGSRNQMEERNSCVNRERGDPILLGGKKKRKKVSSQRDKEREGETPQNVFRREKVS